MTELRILPRPGGTLPDGVASTLAGGGVAIFPTDTLYALGADPRSAEGIGRLFRIKGRGAEKAIPLLLDGAARLGELASFVPATARRLAEVFWPGALTMVLPAAPSILPALLGGGGEVGLRVPAHPLARALAAALGGAVTGTSANRSGNAPRWSRPEDLAGQFAREVDWILWDGPLPPPVPEGGGGLPSTVIRFSGETPVLLREGAIPFVSIEKSLRRG